MHLTDNRSNMIRSKQCRMTFQTANGIKREDLIQLKQKRVALQTLQ
jgi:hypothetical protein